MSVWITIEHAPKDGTPVDLWVKGPDGFMRRYTRCVRTQKGDWHWLSLDSLVYLLPSEGFGKPTHFMPIPPGPGEGS